MNTRLGIIALLVLIGLGSLTAVIAFVLIGETSSDVRYDDDLCHPLVIAHRGASGYVPEHTLGAYALAATMGADYLEPDVVMTRDGQIIARHDNELGLSTDVSQHPEFASRYRTQTVDGIEMTGWFSEDFTLAEIKTLRAVERIPAIRPGNARMDASFEVPTLQEIIDLIKGLEVSLHRPIGIIPEIKHATHFQQLGLAMERPLVDILHNNGYRGDQSYALIQSFEVSNLKELKTITDLRLVQLIPNLPNRSPVDQAILGTGLTYGEMATAEGLREVATYAYSVGPDKSVIIPRNSDNTLGEQTSFVQDAHSAGLKVHPYTFRSEDRYLPAEFQSDEPTEDSIGNAAGELQAFLATGVDGLFVDQPDDMVKVRGTCLDLS